MNYTEFVNPELGSHLEKMKLDKPYHRARAGYLYYNDADGTEVAVKDFVGGYGSLALGHHCPELVDYAKDLLDAGTPVHAQMSIKKYTGALAKFISQEIGSTTGRSYITTFTNSGAETVEAAIKHARLKKVKELNALTDGVNRNLNAISNLFVKGSIASVTFRGREYKAFPKFRDDLLAANQKVIDHLVLRLLASEKSYHGKTFSALKATYNEKYRTPFLMPVERKDTVFFPWDEAFVENALQSGVVRLFVPEINAGPVVHIREAAFNTCIGIIMEPILGEGGVVVVPPSFLRALQGLSLKYKVPLMLDEIQTGAYRTGTILRSLQAGITADYYLLGKALGGGLVKIGALVIDKGAYHPEFGLLHTSTFAEDEFSSAIALKSLNLLKAQAQQVEEVGQSIFRKLQALKELYPGVIREVHGDGLMIGLTFRSFHTSACYPLQFASRSNYFNYLVTSYLLNNCNIRVAPTLSSSFTIRIQPGLGLTEADVHALASGISQVCEVLQAEDFYKFIEKLLPVPFQGLRPLQQFSNGEIRMSSPGAKKKVGFLTHFINEENVVASDPSMAVLPHEAIEGLLTGIIDIGTNIIAGSAVIRDGNGSEVEIVLAGLPFTSGMVRKALLKNEMAPYVKICSRAVEMLVRDFGVDIVGLGQYTSIITSNGTAIPHSNVYLTTGNSFTTYIGLQSVLHEIRKGTTIKKNEEITIGILGAAGNISSVYAKCCSQFVSSIYLKGSDRQAGIERIERSARELLKYIIKKIINQSHVHTCTIERTIRNTRLYQQVAKGEVRLEDAALYTRLQEELGEQSPIKTFSDLALLKRCNLVIVATNAPAPFLTEEHFSPNTIVYDISVPLNVTEGLFSNSKNIKVSVGGVVALPNREVLPLKGYPLEDGTAYACMSETILLGLEHYEGNFSFGNITPELVYRIGSIANKHKFLFHREKYESIL